MLIRPLLKWAGGKSKLAPRLDEAFGEPCRGTWYEPFVGSGAVYLYRRAHGRILGDAVLSDANPKLVALHRAVRDAVDDVLEELARLPVEDYREAYYRVRDAFNAGPHEGPRHAARFVWLNRAGFNGLYRENRDGDLNVPVGSYKRVNLPDEAAFREISELLQGAEILTASFEEVMRRAGSGDHVYCDPPYVPLNEAGAKASDFTAYCRSPFGFPEQRRLASCAVQAARNGARVVLSNHDLPVVRKVLYPSAQGFRIFDSPAVGRAISRDVQSRKPVQEVIATIGPDTVPGAGGSVRRLGLVA